MPNKFGVGNEVWDGLRGQTLNLISDAGGNITGGAPPGTLTVTTTNNVGNTHTHAITTSSNPGAAASILATDVNGQLTLVRLFVGDGTALNPSLALTNETGTGLYRFGLGILGFSILGVNKMVLDGNGLGVKAPAPVAANIHTRDGHILVDRDAPSGAGVLTTFEGIVYGTKGNQLILARARGSIAVPNSPLSGDPLGIISARGYSGGFQERAILQFEATQGWTGAAQGTSLFLYLTASNSIVQRPARAWNVTSTNDVTDEWYDTTPALIANMQVSNTASTWDFNPLFASDIRFFRSTNTVSQCSVQVLAADGTASIVHQFPVKAGGVVILNNQLANIDVQIKGDTQTNLTYWDASQDNVGIGALPIAPAAGAILTLYRSGSGTSNLWILADAGVDIYGGGVFFPTDGLTVTDVVSIRQKEFVANEYGLEFAGWKNSKRSMWEMYGSGELRNVLAADATPFTQTRFTLYRDASNWGYLAYGSDAVVRVVYGKSPSGGTLLFGQSSATDGTGSFTERVRIDSVGGVGINVTPSTATLLHVSKTWSTAVAVNQRGVLSEVTYSIADTGAKTGMESVLTLSHTIGTQADALAYYAPIFATGNGGTTTSLRGVQVSLDISTGHTVSTYRGLWITNASGVGTLTNQYGLYIDNLTKGGSDYGLYIAGADTYAIWVDAGLTRLDGFLGVGVEPSASNAITAVATAAAAAGVIGRNDNATGYGVFGDSNGSSGIGVYAHVGSGGGAASIALYAHMEGTGDSIFATQRIYTEKDYELIDGMTAPGTTAGRAKIYVDSADGDLKVKFGDGFVRVIAADT